MFSFSSFATRNTLQKLVFCCATVLLVLWQNAGYIKQFYEHRYYVSEQDAYMHLVIASDFLKNHHLQESVNYRTNTPWGADTHGWTSFVTLLLAGGALLFHYVMPLSEALNLWAFVVPILGCFCSLWAMLFILKPFKPSTYQQCFVVLAFLLNPLLQTYFLPLRVDYDCVLIPITLCYWGLLIAFLGNTIRAPALGLIACLGLWTSISFMVPLLIGLGFLLWQQLLYQRMSYRRITVFLGGLCCALVPIILLEHQSFWAITHDIISIVHLTFLTGILFAFVLYHQFSPQSIRTQIFAVIACAAALFLVMEYLFPGFYFGPYQEVSPWLRQHLFAHISEFYSPFAIDNALALALLCYFFIGGGYFYFLYLTEGLNFNHWLLVGATTVLVIMTALMYRWSVFSVPLMIVLVSFSVNQFKNKNFVLKTGILILMTFMPTAIVSLENNYFVPAQQACQQQLYSMLYDQFLLQSQFHQDKRLLTYSNYGPLLLYTTPFSVVATNDHHNPQGVRDSIEFFSGGEQQARKIVDARGIDLILLCPAGYHIGFNPEHSPWLQRVPLPQSYDQWHLYRVSR